MEKKYCLSQLGLKRISKGRNSLKEAHCSCLPWRGNIERNRLIRGSALRLPSKKAEMIGRKRRFKMLNIFLTKEEKY